MEASATETSSPPTQTSAEQEDPNVTVEDMDLPDSPEGMLDIELFDMDIPTVITAVSRRKQRLSEVPAAASVVSAEDIRRSGARSVPDALRLVPGMDVAELTYGQYAVSPRGLHSIYANRTLVLVDGRQIYDPMFSGTYWMAWPFQLEDIARIEVIRGPAGVAWGANAMNGVINIVTKDPADQLGVTVTAGGGSQGSHKEYLGYGFADDKLRMRVSGEMEGSDGFQKEGGLPFLSTFDDGLESAGGSVHAIYEASKRDTLTFSGGSRVVNENYPIPFFEQYARLRPHSEASYLMANWSHEFAPDNTFELTGFVNDFHNRSTTYTDYRYQQFALQLRHTFKPAEDHTLTWGIDSGFDLVDAGNSDPYMLSRSYVTGGVLGIYVEDEWQLAERWNLSLGARIDYDSYGGFQPSGRAALSYELSDDSLVYGAVSRAFHMPRGARRFLQIPVTFGILQTTADQDLDPETLLAYELGYRSRWLDDRLELNANVYWHDYDDLFLGKFRFGPPGLVRVNAENGDSFSMYGVELDSKFAVTDELTLLGHYTFQIPDSRAGFNEIGAISPPRHKFMIGARYSPFEDLHLSTHLHYVDNVEAREAENPITARHIDHYFRWDLRAEYEFWEDRASIAAGVRNLLDDHHPEGASVTINTGDVPRMIYAEFRLRLQ